MTVQLVLLKSGESIITDAKELVSEDTVCGYLLKDPQKVIINSSMFLSSEDNPESEVKVSLTPWILLSKDPEVLISKDWVVTLVNPIDSLIEMYLNRSEDKQ